MAGFTLVETRDRVWSPVLAGLRASAMDCIQTSLAAFADLHHGPGTHLALGARLRFTAATDSTNDATTIDATIDGAIHSTIEAPLGQRLAEAYELTGLRAIDRYDRLDGPAVREHTSSAGPLYVVGDAYDMPWTPYHRQRHMSHSFILATARDRFHVIDAYHNETQWGPARPGVWRLTADELDASLAGGAAALSIAAEHRPVPDPAAILTGNARVLRDAAPAIDRYLEQARAGIEDATAVDRLVLDIWLLGRSRLLHATWLATVPGLRQRLTDAAGRQAQEWLRLASQSYVGMRRVQRGAALPPSVLDRLAALLVGDVELTAELARSDLASTGAGSAPVLGDDIRRVVVAEVRAVLRLDSDPAGPAVAFRTLPNFSSFRLVDIIERLETRLGVDLDADELTLDALQDIDSLARLFARAAGRVHR